MNDYIENLRSQGKLNIAIDPTKKFDWQFTKIAGPCSVEGPEIVDIAKKIKSLGANAFRAGAYKPCTFPVLKETKGWKEGLRKEGLSLLREVKKETGLPIVTEVMDISMIDEIAEIADVLQVGTRNFQNYSLLDALGKIQKPILLKRGTWGTIDEILGSCERILVGGNDKIAICLRGVVGMPSYRHVFPTTRWAPDLMMIPALKEFTNIPVIYDPSHSTGYRNFVKPIAKAAIAAGANGLIIECHPDPDRSISDPAQAITYNTLDEIFNG